MKSSAFVCLTLLLAQGAFAQVSTQQVKPTKEQIIEKVCRAPEIRTGAEFDEMRRVEQKVGTVINQDRQHRTYIALVDSNVINAWATNFNMADSMICVPVAMVHFMGDAEGELAFILSHEIGHTVDDQCKTQEGRLAVAQSRGSLGAWFGGLLGGQEGAAASSRLSVDYKPRCETTSMCCDKQEVGRLGV